MEASVKNAIEVLNDTLDYLKEYLKEFSGRISREEYFMIQEQMGVLISSINVLRVYN